jgi:hypothetical protein
MPRDRERSLYPPAGSRTSVDRFHTNQWVFEKTLKNLCLVQFTSAGAGFDKQMCSIQFAFLSSEVERCHSIFGLQVQIGPVEDQIVDDLRLSMRRRPVQSRVRSKQRRLHKKQEENAGKQGRTSKT